MAQTHGTETGMNVPVSQPPLWPPCSLVIFDCDSTLSAVEGIDELARLVEAERGPGEPGTEKLSMALSIAMLTKRAMEGDLPLEAVYGQRLMAIQPTQSQARQVARIYRERMIPDAAGVIAALQSLGVQVFIVSGGLIEPVREFGVWLGVPEDHIYAVEIEWDPLAGQWWRYWEQPYGRNPEAVHRYAVGSPLTGSQGKNRVIARLRALHPGRALLAGDGLSDLEAGETVDLFAGFGGAVYRERVAQESPVYLRSLALSPLLPLALGKAGLSPPVAALWADGLRRINAGEVVFREPDLSAAFWAAMQRRL